jgi:hypothetical protein
MEKTIVAGERDFIRNKTIPIHHKPQPPTLILATHVPIIMHMGMMSITISHFIKSYNRANHMTPMLIRVKVLGKARKGKVGPTT